MYPFLMVPTLLTVLYMTPVDPPPPPPPSGKKFEEYVKDQEKKMPQDARSDQNGYEPLLWWGWLWR